MANTRVVALTIDADLVAATESDFPVLLTRANFPDEMFFGGNSARTDGGDLRFYTDEAGTTEIPREIVAFEHDSSLGADDAVIQVWVKVPSLSSATDTTIYCQYGDGTLTDYAATDPFGRNAVWAGCHAAWHLQETPAQTASLYKDSAGNYDLDGVDPDGTQVTGPWGGTAVNFIDGHHATSTAAGLASVPTGHDFTISFWAKRAGYSTANAAVGWNGSDDLYIYPNDSNNAVNPSLRVFWRDIGGNFYAVGGGADDVWQHVSVTSRAADDHEARVNYSTVGTSSSSGTTGPFSDFFLGATGGQFFLGALAGVRIYSGARSAEWLATEYNNQSSPSTFITVGTPTDVGGGGATYNDTIAEAVTAADGMVAVATWAASLTESVALADSYGSAMAMAAALAEAADATDSYAGTVEGGSETYNEAISEAVTAADVYAATASFATALSEALTTAATYAAGNRLAVAISEAVTVGDSVAHAVTWGPALAEALSAADNYASQAALTGSLTEALLTADSFSASGGTSLLWIVQAPTSADWVEQGEEAGSWTVVSPTAATWTEQ